MPDKISIYAELLPNIRQVTVVASLPSPCGPNTRAVLLGDGSRIHLTHDGETSVLDLPGRVQVESAVLPKTSPQLSGTAARAGDARQLTWRLPLPQLSNGQTARSGPELANTSHVPWEAVRMQPACSVSCRSCGAKVVPARRITEWKDLPSENWAEMMEFWHCHKPDDKHDHHHQATQANGHANGAGAKADERSLTARGYGANSIISAQRGVGFVDLMALLFAVDDCEGLTLSLSSFEHGSQSLASCPTEGTGVRTLNAFCTACGAKLGYYNFRSSAMTLFKWRVLCDESAMAGPPPSIGQCLAATLMALVARTGSSKSLIIPPRLGNTATPTTTPSTVALHVWILNAAIRFATTSIARGGRKSTSAIKMLFRTISMSEADSMLESMHSDAQDISLPEESLIALIQMLQESNNLLPADDRVFQGWKVGLLERWEEYPLA